MANSRLVCFLYIKASAIGVVICCAYIFGAHAFSDADCVKGSYPPKESPAIATYVVNLDKPPMERWNEVVHDKGPALSNLLAKVKGFLLNFGRIPKEILSLIDKDLGGLADHLPSPFGDEMKGIAKATNLPLGEIVLFNIFYEVFTACTSIVATTPQGRMYHARNMDFGLFLGWNQDNHTWLVTEALKPMVVNLNFTRGGHTQFKAISFAGYVGILTGMKPGVFTLTINERFQLGGGFIGILQWILGKPNLHWMGFLSRSTLENCTSYTAAKSRLSQSPMLAPVYFILGGVKPSQACVITRDRTKVADTWLLGTRNSTWFLLETNYDHWKTPLFLDDRRTPGYACMRKLTQKKLSFAGLFDVLSTKPVRNKLTVYTALMQVDTGSVEAYLRSCPDPCSPW